MNTSGFPLKPLKTWVLGFQETLSRRAGKASLLELRHPISAKCGGSRMTMEASLDGVIARNHQFV